LYEVRIEDVKVTGVEDAFDGLVTLLCCCLLFNVKFSAYAHKTLSYICGCLLKIPNVKMPHSVVKALNSQQAQHEDQE